MINKLGLGRIEGSTKDNIDGAEGELIWRIHEEVPIDLRDAVYKVRKANSHGKPCSNLPVALHVMLCCHVLYISAAGRETYCEVSVAPAQGVRYIVAS